MKKIFTLLMVALFGGAIGASAQTTYVLDKSTCKSEEGGASPFEFSSNGKTFTITNSKSKTLDYGNAKDYNLDNGIEYVTSTDYTVVIPENVNIVAITFRGFANDNNKASLTINSVKKMMNLFQEKM